MSGCVKYKTSTKYPISTKFPSWKNYLPVTTQCRTSQMKGQNLNRRKFYLPQPVQPGAKASKGDSTYVVSMHSKPSSSFTTTKDYQMVVTVTVQFGECVMCVCLFRSSSLVLNSNTEKSRAVGQLLGFFVLTPSLIYCFVRYCFFSLTELAGASLSLSFWCDHSV